MNTFHLPPRPPRAAMPGPTAAPAPTSGRER